MTPVVRGPVTPGADNTIPFSPSNIEVDRNPAACGADPPLIDGDDYEVWLIGRMTPTTPATQSSLYITFVSPVPVSWTLSLTVEPFEPCATALCGMSGSFASQSASGGGIGFDYIQGTDPAEIDTGAFDSVAVTILAMPAKDGDPLSILLQVHFVDGRVLDESFSGPLVTQGHGCAAG